MAKKEEYRQQLPKNAGNKKKRICVVRNSYYDGLIPNKRNAEALIAEGYDVDIICMKDEASKGPDVINGMRIYRLPIIHKRKGLWRYAYEYLGFLFLAFWKLARLSPKQRYAVVEVSGIPDFLVFCAIVPRLMGAKVVLNLFDHTPEVFMEHFKISSQNIVVKMLRVVEKISVRWVHFVIGTQIINKQKAEGMGVPSSRIAVVLNVPNEHIFNSHYSANHDDGTFRLITHGSLLERYGVQILIKALPLLVKEIPNLRLKIVGQGEYKPRLEQMTQSLEVSKYVEFTGKVPQTEVPRYIANAHIGICTILTKTNPMLPNKLFEYLAMGKPAVVGSIPAIRAYFDDSSVMYYEPDDEHDLARCVLELYRDKAKREKLAAAGQASYKKYRWSSMKHEYLKVFEQLTKT